MTSFKTQWARAGAVAIVLGLLGSAESGEPGRRYVKTSKGQRPQPIVAVDNVCAWPNLTVLPDGAIIATIFNKPCHGTMAGDVECWATTDGGRTWLKRGTPAPHEPDTNRMNVAAGLARNGDLIALCGGWSNQYPPGKSGHPFRARFLPPWLCRSDDGGRTWVIDKESFTTKLPTGGAACPFGDIIEGHDETLRVAFYSASGAYVYRSRDDGKTWDDPVPIDEQTTRHEPALFHRGDGKWLAAVRIDGLHLYESIDDARTWRFRERLTGKAQHPGHFLRLCDGRLLLSYGNRTPSEKGVDVRFSDDEGKTWSEPMRVVDFEGDGGYPSSVQLPGGQVLTAYYARRIEGHNRYHMGVVIWDAETPLRR